jgi:hypothetical protein
VLCPTLLAACRSHPLCIPIPYQETRNGVSNRADVLTPRQVAQSDAIEEGEARCFREERSAEYEVTDYGQVREIVATCGLTGFVWSICSSIRELKLTQPAEVSEDSLARLGSGINQGISQLTGRG